MKHSIPIKLVTVEEKGIHLLINATVNGQSALFIIDTGASQTVMDQQRAEQFLNDAEVAESETLSKGLGTDSMQSFTSKLDSLIIGDFKIENQEIVLLDLSHVINSYVDMGHAPIDGVIGGDVLSTYNAVIDYASKSITLSV